MGKNRKWFNHKGFFAIPFAVFALVSLQPTSALAEGENNSEGSPEIISTDSSTSETYDFKNSGLQRHSATGSTTSWSRSVSTMISLYVKNGTVPQITKYDGTYNGVAYHVLEADTSDGNTIIKLDYAGSTPQPLSEMYDSTLTANDEYYWAGAINAGFFSMANGYPTGAVRTNGAWQTYTGAGSNYETWDCAPAYGSGFTSVYFNQSNNSMKLLYNGWKGGVFYKYYNDASPNTWDLGEVWNYTEGVSGAYTLMVDGDTSVHWGKDAYSGTNYWNYVGSAITLFGQKANGNYVLLTTSSGSLTANQAIDLMSKLGCVNGIRFDGGGSSQMAYDNGLYIKSVSAPKTAEISSKDALDEIKVTVTDGDGKTHKGVAITDLSDDISTTDVDSDGNFMVTASTVVGDITVNATVHKAVTTLSATFSKGYAVVGDSVETIKNDITAIKEIVDDVESDLPLSDATIEVTGDTSKANSTVTITIKHGDISKSYSMLVLDSTQTYYASDVAVGVPALKTAIVAKDELPTFGANINGNVIDTTNITLDGIDVSKTGVQTGTATFAYYTLSKDDGGLVTGTNKRTVKAEDIVIYVQGVTGITINTEKDSYVVGDELGTVTATFEQENVDGNASVDDIEIDTSNVDTSVAGTYKITASYTPSATVEVKHEKLNYTKGSTTGLNYDWQLGTNYNISANSKPTDIDDATIVGLDSNLANISYAFKEQDGSYILVGGVDESEYIRFSEDDTTAYIYKFEPYHWSSATESGTLVSSSTDTTWLSSEWVFGAKATKGYKYAGHKTESTSGTLIQNCWSVTRTAYTVTKDITTTEEKIYAPVAIEAEKQVIIQEAPITTYNVNFYDFDGNLLDTVVVAQGQEAITDKVPEKEGYNFTSWNTDTANVQSDLDIYPTFTCSDGYNLVDNACTVHVDPEPEPDLPEGVHHVSFDWNYANSGNVWGVDGSEIVLPENSFIKDGYKFVCWNTSINGDGTNYYPGDILTAQDFSESSSMMLYATWEKDTSSARITFDWNYANRGFMPAITVSEGDVLPSNNFERDGYIFKGWNTSINSDGTHYDNEAVMPALESDIVLYAEWEEATRYEIRFDWNYANGGSVDNIVVYNGEPCILPENNFTKDNYEFIGWNTSINGDGATYQPNDTFEATSSTTLYAMWQKTSSAYSYIVSYDWNYANSGSMGVDFGTNAEGYIAPECNFKRDKKVFTSWNTSIDGTGRVIETGEELHDIANDDNEHIILYAQWRDAGVTKIIYDWNYANSGSMPITYAYENSSVQLAKNTFKRDGKAFVGWNTSIDGTGDSFTDEDVVSLYDSSKETIVLYAQWN